MVKNTPQALACGDSILVKMWIGALLFPKCLLNL